MAEHVARTLYYFQVHLLYASIVWLAAWVLTSLRRGSATTTYWIWVATSLNFVVPTGAIFDKVWASHLSWARPLGFIGEAAGTLSRGSTAVVLGLVWFVGAAIMLRRVCLRIRAESRDARAAAGRGAPDARPGFLARGIPVRFAETRRGPAVDGILNPRIALPDGIDRLLNEQELDAVLVHEVTHARRRDNLIRLVHEVGLCLLWFHPFVWITGSRMTLYRELSCDEPVIQSAHGRDLVSALAKLANPEEAFLLQATASSFMSHRLARLAAVEPQRSRRAANAILAVMFAAVLLAGVAGTVSHTACCFVLRP